CACAHTLLNGGVPSSAGPQRRGTRCRSSCRRVRAPRECSSRSAGGTARWPSSSATAPASGTASRFACSAHRRSCCSPPPARLQGLPLEVILRAVFGLDPGPRLDAVRERLTEVLAFGASPLSLLPPLQLPVGPWRHFARLRAEVDALLFELIDERRREGADRD